jgi:hypothetical protein
VALLRRRHTGRPGPRPAPLVWRGPPRFLSGREGIPTLRPLPSSDLRRPVRSSYGPGLGSATPGTSSRGTRPRRRYRGTSYFLASVPELNRSGSSRRFRGPRTTRFFSGNALSILPSQLGRRNLRGTPHPLRSENSLNCPSKQPIVSEVFLALARFYSSGENRVQHSRATRDGAGNPHCPQPTSGR